MGCAMTTDEVEVRDESVTEEPEKLTLLLLDDEADIIKTLTRVLRMEYNVVSFNEGEEAIAYLKENDAAIIISDMRMPQMDGAKFLSIAKKLRPASVRLLLTGYSDMESTIRAVNEGGIHTYLAKPWDNEGLKLVVAKAAEFYRLTQERDLLTQTLEQKNKELADFNQQLETQVLQRTKALREANVSLEKLLKARNQTFNDILATLKAIIQYSTGVPADHSDRVAEQSKAVATLLKLSDQEINQVYLCGLLHEIGLAARKGDKPELVKRTQGVPSTPEANATLGAEIIGQIKRFAPLVNIIRHQDENYNGTGGPSHLKESDIPIGARIIRVVKNYDYFVASDNNRHRMTAQSAQNFLKEYSEVLYDPIIVEAFLKVIGKVDQKDGIERCVSISDVKVGTVVKRDVFLPNGSLMLTAGQEINSNLLEKLKRIEKDNQFPIAIFI